MNEEFISIAPKHDLLTELIDHYYVHKVINPGNSYTVIYYPHYVTAINLYQNAEVTWDDQGRTIAQADDATINCLLTRNIKTSKYVTIHGSVNKIGIIFKPLGINHFLDSNLSHIAPDVVSEFTYFGAPFQSLAKTLFQSNIEEIRTLLDNFFLEQYIGFQDVTLKEIVRQMLRESEDKLLKDIAEQAGLHRKTVLRKFRNNLCMTPTELKTLTKFRGALHQFNTDDKLTNIGYNSNYYDQSHFIRNFKSLVGQSPKTLYSRLSQLGENGTLWTKIT